MKRELGLDAPKPAAPPVQKGPPSSTEELILRCRLAVNQKPPKLVHALYQAKDANTPTWRHLAVYSTRDRGVEGSTLIFAACEKEGWEVEAFRVGGFKDLQVTDKPWPFQPRFRIELRDM